MLEYALGIRPFFSRCPLAWLSFLSLLHSSALDCNCPSPPPSPFPFTSDPTPCLHFVASQAICVIICFTLIAQMRRRRRPRSGALEPAHPYTPCTPCTLRNPAQLITADWPHKLYSTAVSSTRPAKVKQEQLALSLSLSQQQVLIATSAAHLAVQLSLSNS